MNIKTLSRWLTMTEFEMLLNVICFTIFSILLCVRLDFYPNIEDSSNLNILKWLHVFLPLFLVDLLQANFITIVFMRQLKEKKLKEGLVRLFFSLLLLLCRFLFKLSVFFLVTRSTFKVLKTIESNTQPVWASLDDPQYYSNNSPIIDFHYVYDVKKAFKFQLAAMPLFLHLSILMFRSCCLKKYQSFS